MTLFLRRLGAFALVTSGATFMWQGWGNLTSFQRYFSFLGLVLVVAAAGVFCARALKEDKGARTLLAIATAALTVPVSQLAAMLFATFSHHPSLMPNAFTFMGASLAEIGASGAVTLALLLPISYLGFSALARPIASRLTALSLALNMVLLIPVREASGVATLITLMAAGYATVEWQWFRRNARLEGTDGLIVRGILLAPLATLVIRNMLYPWSFAFSGSLAFVAGIGLFVFARPRPLRDTGVGFLLLSWVLAAGEFATNDVLGADAILVVLLPLSAFLFVLSLFDLERGRRFRIAASYWATMVAVFHLFAVGGMVASFVTVLAGVTLVAVGYFRRERNPLLAGTAAVLVGTAHHVSVAVDLVTSAPWVSFAVLGLAALVGSSYVERNRAFIVECAVRLQARWKEYR